MITARLALAQATRTTQAIRGVASSSSARIAAVRAMSTLTPRNDEGVKKVTEELDEIEAAKSPVQRKMEAMTKVDPWMVYGSTEPDELPSLPDNPAEIASLDIAQRVDAIQPDGTERVVHIRQEQWEPGQSNDSSEKTWIISFLDEGTRANNWTNPLMGWVSGSDPMASNIQLQLQFDSASQAVYFAKKRGWTYIVDEPIFRFNRGDGAQYQDNFLPKIVTADVKLKKTQCKQWERSAACTSHYHRPLKYHGDGEVPQYGPHGDAPVVSHVEGCYKMR